MFSVGILAIACIGVISVLTYGLLTGDSVGNFSTATQLSREVIEAIRADQVSLGIFDQTMKAELVDASVNAASFSARPLVNAKPLDDPLYGLPTNNRFRRNIQIQQMGTPTTMVRIQVRIYWEQNNTLKWVESVAFKRGVDPTL